MTLEPCPHCGDPIKLPLGIESNGTYYGWCRECGHCGPSYKVEADAVRAWNTLALVANDMLKVALVRNTSPARTETLNVSASDAAIAAGTATRLNGPAAIEREPTGKKPSTTGS